MVIVAVPLTTLQSPVPVTGILPVNVKLLLLHWFCAAPATAVVGVALLVKMISSCVGAHTPLLVVQRSVAVLPAVMPVMVVVAEFILVIVAVPLTTVQVPVPIAAGVAAIVNVLVLHCVMLGRPASAGVGFW